MSGDKKQTKTTEIKVIPYSDYEEWAVRAVGKPAIGLHVCPPEATDPNKTWDEWLNRVHTSLRGPAGKDEIRDTLLSDYGCLVFFDTDEERDEFYDYVDGDDTGGVVYAATYDRAGHALNENT